MSSRTVLNTAIAISSAPSSRPMPFTQFARHEVTTPGIARGSVIAKTAKSLIDPGVVDLRFYTRLKLFELQNEIHRPCCDWAFVLSLLHTNIELRRQRET